MLLPAESICQANNDENSASSDSASLEQSAGVEGEETQRGFQFIDGLGEFRMFSDFFLERDEQLARTRNVLDGWRLHGVRIGTGRDWWWHLPYLLTRIETAASLMHCSPVTIIVFLPPGVWL